MEDKNQNTGVIYPGGSNPEPLSALPVAQAPVDYGPGALSGEPITSPDPAPPRMEVLRRTLKPMLKWSVVAGIVLMFLVGIFLLLKSARQQTVHLNEVNPAASFGSQAIPLNALGVNIPEQIQNAGQVTVNGRLQVGDGIVLAPSLQPSTPQPGQLYYDQGRNALGYFNGTAFTFLDNSSGSGNVVEQIAGLTGQVGVGAGLAVVGGQLANSGVLSVQGQVGAVTLTGGSGITVNGTSITNTGVVSVTSANPSVVVSNDGNGNLTLDFVGGGSGTVASAGGTAGRIAKFTSSQNIADSLLSESGTVITVNGDLSVTGSAVLGSPLTVANGGTGRATLPANGVLVGNGASGISSIVAGSAGLCLVSTGGAPAWSNCTSPTNAVQSLNLLTGNITINDATGLVNQITINSASTSQKGLAQFNGTNFTDNGSGLINTVQDISTASSPTFNTLTLGGNLVVQGGTSTLGTLSQAGQLVISDGSANTVTVVADNLSADRVYHLPDAGGNATLCVTSGNCIGGSGSAPNSSAYLVATLDGTLTNERALAGGSNISLTDGGANGNLTVATVQNPTFTTSVTTPQLQSSGALVISSAAGQTVAINAGTTIELQDSTNVTGSLGVSVALNVGTGNAFAVNASGAITAAAGITSSGTIVFSALNCTTFANGGALTTNGSGQLVCSDDDGGAGSGITGSGTTNTIPLFSGTNSLTNSIITQSGTTIAVAGDLTLTTDLAVSEGGTGNSSFTANGVLYGNGGGALQVTAAGTGGQVLVANNSGVPTFVGFSGDVNVAANGAVTIQPDSVALGTDTTGNYVSALGSVNGLTVGGTSGEGAVPTLSVNYGSSANTAVQGNVTVTCPSGTGNLTGGGDSITLGLGGTCGDLSIVGNPTFTTSVTTPQLVLTGSGNSGTLQVANLGQATTYTLPDPGQATADICLSIGNCATAGAAGGDLTGNYPNPTIAKLQGTDLAINTPAAGNVLVWNGTDSSWENQAVSGDITLSETGVATIQNGAVSNAKLQNSWVTVTSGTGLSGGGSVSLGSSTTLNLADTTVTLGSYGSASNVATFTVDQQGRLTAAGSTPIAIAGTQITTGTIDSSRLDNTTVTLQGNTFNGANQLVQLNASGELPVLSGINLTNLNASNLASGTVDPSRISGSYTGITGVGTVVAGTWQADAVDIAYGGTGANTSQGAINAISQLTTEGDLLYYDGANATRLARGSNNQCLVSTATSVQWASCTSGGGVSGSGTSGQVAYFNGTGSITSDVDLLFDGTTLTSNTLSVTNGATVGGTLTVQGASATIGTTSQQGSLVLHDGNGQTTTLQAGDSSGNLTFVLPVNTGSANQCLKAQNGIGALFWDDCEGGTGGVSGVTTLNSLDGALIVQGTTNHITVSDNGTDTITLDVGSSVTLQGNTFNGANQLVQLNASGELPALSGVNLTNLNASNLASGTVDPSRISGSYTGVTGVGTVTAGTWNATSIADAYIDNNITISSSGTVDWTALNNYPTACSAGEAVTAVGDTLTCAAFAAASGSGAYINNSVSIQTGANLNIQSNGTTAITANFQVLASQTADVLRVRDSGDTTTLFEVQPDGDVVATSFSGDGSGLTNLNGSNISSGTISNARLTGSGALTVTAGTGLTGGGSVSLGGSTSLSVSYGSSAGTAVQGNVTLTCPSGTGNLTGGGTTITLGTGGTCGAIDTVASPTFTGNVTIQGTTGLTFNTGAGGDITFANGEKIDNDTNGTINLQANSGALTLLLTGTAGTVTNSAGTLTLDSFNNTLTVASSDTTLSATGLTALNLGTNTSINSGGTITLDATSTVIIPGADTFQTDDVTSTGALTLVSGGTGDITIDSAGTIQLQDATTIASTLAVQGASVTIGGNTQLGSLILYDGSSNTGTIQTASLAANRVYTLPDPGSDATICLSTGNCGAAGTAGGDLTGSYPNPTIAKLQGVTLTAGSPSTNQILQYNGSAWVNQTIGGDISLSGSTATIATDAVTSGKILDGTIANGDLSSGSFTNITGVGTLTGLTIQGTANINTTGTASTAIGNSTGTFSITSSGLNVTTAGALSGVTGITTSGGYTQSGSTANGFSGATTFSAAGTALTVNNNATISGVLSANTITPSGAMTIGAAGQNLTLQGNGTTKITATDSGNTTTIGFITPTANTTINFPALSAGTYTVCTSQGNCAGAGVTLQNAYNNSTDPEITVDATRGALTVRDASSPIGANLLEVQNNGGSTTYFAVTAGGIQTTGTMVSSSDINTTGGAIQTNGTTRIDNSGNLLNIGNITATGAAINIGADNAAHAVNIGTGAAAQTVAIGSTNSTSSLALNAGSGGLTVVGSTTIQNTTNSANALQLQNALGIPGFNIDTTSSNLITNSSFETNTTGWSAKGSASISRITSASFDNAASMQVSVTAAGGGTTYPYSLASSTQYSFSVYVRRAPSGTFSTLEIGRSENGSTDTSCATGQTATSGNWTRVSCTFTTGTVSGSPYVYIKQTDATSRSWYIDAVKLETAASATQYLTAKTSLNGNLVINGGQNIGSNNTATLYVQANAGGSGVVIRGNGDLLQNALTVAQNDGTGILFVNDTSLSVAVQGGSSFYDTAALRVTSTNSGARGLDVKGASGQTADILNVKDNSNAVMFSVGATGAVTAKNTANSTSAFKVQNAAGTSVLNIDTTNSTVSIGSTVATQDFESATFPPASPGTWTTGGNANWARTTSQFEEGTASAASGTITDSQTSWLDLNYTFVANGMLSFYWKVDSESCGDTWCDGIYLLVDNDAGTVDDAYTKVQGDSGWVQVNVPVAAGAHSFRWVYTKDDGSSNGADKAWLDNVRFIEGGLAMNGPVTTDLTIQSSLTVGGDLQAAGDISANNVDVEGTVAALEVYAADDVITNDDVLVGDALYVTGQSYFYSDVNVQNGDSATAFTVFNASDVPQFQVDSTNSRVYIGNPTADATGTPLVLDTKNTSGDPTGVDGGMYYNSADGAFRCYQAGSWQNCSGASAVEYMRAKRATGQGTMGTNDHVNFTAVDTSSGSSVSLDTTTTYTTGGGASQGRFTLAAGKTYHLSAQVGYIDFAGSGTANQVRYGWYNVTSGTQIGSNGGNEDALFTTDHQNFSSYAEGVITTSVTTIVEVRVISQTGLEGMCYGPECSAYIEVLSDGAKVAQFQGATASTDGQSGFVPAPVAGQQGSLLVGDGNWSSGLTFLNTTTDRGLLLQTTTSAYLNLNADTDNDGSETGSAYIRLAQDGGQAFYLGTIQTTGLSPVGASYTDTLSNALLIGSVLSGQPLQFGTSAAVRMTIDSSGNVGIGSTTPGALLDVNSSADPIRLRAGMTYASDAYNLGAATGNGIRYITLSSEEGSLRQALMFADASSASSVIFGISSSSDSGSSWLRRFSVQQDGKVGIGNTAPSGVFDVLQDDTAGNSSYFRRSSGQYLELRTNAGGDGLFAFSDSGNAKYLNLGSDTNSSGIQFYTGSTTSGSGTLRLTIDSATGNIIVGQSNTTGTLLVLDTKTNSGDPTGVNGGMYYNSNLGTIRCYENGTWRNCGGRDYMQASAEADQTTNISNNDHVKFDTTLSSIGSSISRSGAAYPSFGRFTLAAGGTYKLEANVDFVGFGAAGSVLFEWYDVTNSAVIGLYQATSGDASNAGRVDIPVRAYITTTASTVVELRMTNVSNVNRLGLNAFGVRVGSAIIERL